MPEDFMRGVVYAFLLGHGFLGGRHKVLKKVPESNNMNKLMGDDIECEREKFNMGGLIQGGKDGMVLDANLVKIVCGRSQGIVFPLAFVSDDLCIRTLDDFVRLKICQGFNIVCGSQPLVGRHSIIIADKLLRHCSGIVYDFNLIRVESRQIFHLGLFAFARIPCSLL